MSVAHMEKFHNHGHIGLFHTDREQSTLEQPSHICTALCNLSCNHSKVVPGMHKKPQEVLSTTLPSLHPLFASSHICQGMEAWKPLLTSMLRYDLLGRQLSLYAPEVQLVLVEGHP